MRAPKGLGTVAELLKRFSKAEERYQQWRSHHQECFDYAAPERENFSMSAPGQRKNRHIYDSTAVMGLTTYASIIQSSVTPSWMQWMDLMAGDEIPENEKERTDKELEKTTKTFFSHLNSSNFSTEISPAFSDYGIGTGGILVEENPMGEDDVLRFTNIPLSELYLERDRRNVWRKFKMDPYRIATVYPNADLGNELSEMAKKMDSQQVELCMGMLLNKEQGGFTQVVFYKKRLIFTQDFKTQRLIVFRNTVMPGESYGRGPIMQMLPDIRTVNKVKEFMLQNAALQMSGVYTGVSDGVFNPYTVKIAPGTIIPVNSNNPRNPSMAPLPLSGDLRLGDLIIADLQEGIKKALMVNPLGEFTDPVRSATEQFIRRQENLEQRGASLGRLYSELIQPLVSACIEILQSRGLVAEFRVDGKEVKIKMQSPLAKAENLDDFRNAQVWLSSLAGLPEEVTLAAVKLEEVPEYFAEKLGVPLRLIRDEAEQKKITDSLLQAAAMLPDKRSSQTV